MQQFHDAITQPQQQLGFLKGLKFIPKPLIIITTNYKNEENMKRSRDLLVGLGIVHHVLIGIGLSINPSLSPFNRQSKSVHDDNGVPVRLALHEAHDLDGPTGTGVYDHLQEREGGDLDALEVVGVVGPGLLLLELGLRRLVVVEYGVGRRVRLRLRHARRRVHGDYVVL